MKYLSLASTLMFAFLSVGIVRGQVVSKETADPPAAVKVVVDKTKTGENVLVVQYPWQIHAKASIEVRLITDQKDFDARVRPLRFATIRFEPDAERRVFSTFDEALARPSEWKADAGGLKWEVIGHANHLGRAAVWFVNTPEKGGSLVGTTAAFHPLDAWAISDRLLMLDLPRGRFSQPGKMYIWFLRGDRILWQEELIWPGQNAAKDKDEG